MNPPLYDISDEWPEEPGEHPIFQKAVPPFPGRDPYGASFWPDYQERKRKRLLRSYVRALGRAILPLLAPLTLLGFSLWLVRVPNSFRAGDAEWRLRPVSQIQNVPETCFHASQGTWLGSFSPWQVCSGRASGWTTPLGDFSTIMDSQLVETVLVVDHVASTPPLWQNFNLYLDAPDPGTLYGAVEE
jgi:hypothetical protein